MRTTQQEMRQVETTQIPPLQKQQRQNVGRSITVSVIYLCTQLIQKGEQLPLQSCSQWVRATQARQNWGHDEPLLGLPHVFTSRGQFQSMLDQAREPRQPALFDLAGCLEISCAVA